MIFMFFTWCRRKNLINDFYDFDYIWEKDNLTPKKSYNIIQEALAKLSPTISLKNISVISPSHKLIKLIGAAIHTGPGISDIKFSNNVINNILIEDAHIYRINIRPYIKK